jgi:hypothetical protein
VNGVFIAQLTPDIQLYILDLGCDRLTSSIHVGEWPTGNSINCTVFSRSEARVDVDDDDGGVTLWFGSTTYKLPWLELLKVADFLQIDIPLQHPPEGTLVQS